MISRDAAGRLKQLATLYPVVTVTGPRQSGKTTLCRATFPDLPYVSLEPLDVRDQAVRDPRGFLASLRSGAVLDEVQRVPELVSYLQPEVDRDASVGRFILTGSQQLAVSATVNQSLAGRTGILELFPPSWGELQRFPTAPRELFEAIWAGAYPRIFDRGIPASQWLADYVATYVQRDVRDLLRVGDLRTFSNFVRLCAGRTASEVNASRLGADAGLSHNTAKAWLSVLEASYLVFELTAWHRNTRKQVIKAPKLHFIDTGLACHLLGIGEPEQLRTHPLRGALFETWVAAEARKRLAHDGNPGTLAHYRHPSGLEVDLVVDRGPEALLVEAKSGATVAGDFTAGILGLTRQLAAVEGAPHVRGTVVYGGESSLVREGITCVPWRDIGALVW
jgi:uncharacterized protein